MNKLLSVREAASLIGVGKDKLYEIIREHADFPAFKIGQITKIHPLKLDRWLIRVIEEDRKL